MKNKIILSIFTIISFTATQCMPMTAVKSFFSKHRPTYEQVVTAIKSAPTAFTHSIKTHKTLTAITLLATATCALPQTRKALSRGIRTGLNAIRSRLKHTYESATLNSQLLNAAKKGHPRITRILLAAKANINATKHSNDKTPLHLAAKYGHLDVVKVLIDSHANIAAKDYESETPLHHAAKYGHLDIVHVLLAARADHGLQDCWGKTALYWAIERQHFAVAKCLIDAGASTEGMNLHVSGYDAYTRSL